MWELGFKNIRLCDVVLTRIVLFQSYVPGCLKLSEVDNSAFYCSPVRQLCLPNVNFSFNFFLLSNVRNGVCSLVVLAECTSFLFWCVHDVFC